MYIKEEEDERYNNKDPIYDDLDRLTDECETP